MKLFIVLWDQNYDPIMDKWCQGGLLDGVYTTWEDARQSIKDDLKRRQSNGAKFKRMQDIEQQYSASPDWFIYEVNGGKYYSYVIVEHTLEIVSEIEYP